MRIKSLELNGFKSFVDKTAIRFGPGITGIVGPNGCGKSNVVDAIRWAMGEQSPRRLRGRGMEDVIFCGSEGVAPVGMSEVILTFDNTDGTGPPAFSAYREIQVARRLYRSGESEYLLNKTACRLRDIQDFFRDSGIGAKGYTIVEQGRISEIVSAKAEERRSLIEEAAGIGKYKVRRREAESKIASTEQNLLRVTDVLGEIRRQIGSIERQAKKAARYKRLRETLRVLELSLALDDRAAFNAQIASAGERLASLRDEVTAFETRLAERELSSQEKRIEQSECERILSEGSERLFALRTVIKECEAIIDFGRRERESLAEMVVSREEELARLREQLALRKTEIEESSGELEALEAAVASEAELLERAEAEVREARSQQIEIERERDAANHAIVEILTKIARAEDRLANDEDRSSQLHTRLRSADDELEKGQSASSRADSEQHSLEEGLRNLFAERDRFMELLRDALETHERSVETQRESAEQLRLARESREMKRARLDSLKELVERRDDVGAGTRHLLSQDESTRRRMGLVGLVRDVLEVDRDVERAVEAVLAERTEAIVVERHEGALSALDLLRATESGRGIFIAQSALEPAPSGFVPMGEPLLSHVRARPGHEGLALRLLGEVNLVENLSQVLEVYRGGAIPATFVTRSGDVLTPDGVISGGTSARGESSGHISRVGEIRDLEREVAELEQGVARCDTLHNEATSGLARSSDQLENLRNRHHTAALAVANHEKDLERTRERVKALGEAHEGRVAERSEILGEHEALAADALRLAQVLADARQERAQGQQHLDALGLRAGAKSRDVARLETVATERRVEQASRRENRDRMRNAHERAENAVGETSEWIERRELEIQNANVRREELALEIDVAKTQLDENLGLEEVARAGTEGKREAFERVAGEVNELDEGTREIRNDLLSKGEEVNAAELVVRETELKLTHIDESIRDKWDVELTTWTLPPLDEGLDEALDDKLDDEPVASQQVSEGAEAPVEAATTEPGAAGDTLGEEEEPSANAARDARENAALARLPHSERERYHAEIRGKIQSLGDVNLGAIEEHEDLSERFRFLSEQKTDLESTLGSLRDAIARINRTSRRQFRETFEEISKRFSENFPRLFRGGKASLALTETEDVLEAGIEIMAQPPGKRLQNVNLLSGGEKTLTAIALLVAVFQVRPSPFFLLDEVDAALDDANVGRFNEIVRELAKDSQFVLITHNKRTIEIVDVLYGVTMERKGVSKMVSVKLSEASLAG